MFIFDDQAHFTCTSCGKCCRSGFEIPLQAEKAESIRASEPYLELAREGLEPLHVMAGDYNFLAYDEQGDCFFLKDNLCRLHQCGGVASKPVICQLYPLNLVKTPDGTFVSTLFSCPAVLAGNGEPLSRQGEALEELLSAHQGKVPHLPPIKEHVLVTGESTVTWPQYLELESRIFEHYSERDPVRYLLRVACLLIAPEPQRVEFGVVPPDFEETLDGYFVPLVQEMLAYLEQEHGHPEVEDFLGCLQCGSEAFSERLGCSLSKFEILRPSSQLESHVVARYVRNQLHGKLLLSGPSLVCRLVLVAAALAILLLDLESRRVADGVPHFSFQHLEEAFEVCEERLVSQSNDLEPLLTEFEEMLLSRFTAPA